MTRKTICAICVICVACAIGGLRAQSPASYVYAITGARIVPVSAAVIENGTIVFRDGVITSVGAGIAAPAGAQIIAGKGLTVYPGLIDMGNTAGVEAPAARSESPQTTEDVERAKKDTLLRAHVRAADFVNPAAPALARMAAAGITSSLATPAGEVFKGQSALMNTALPVDDPQIGALADERRGAVVLRTPVALHVSFPERPPGGDAYPNSLMGVIAFVRQQFLDAQHYQAAAAQAERARRPMMAAYYKAAYEAMQPAFAGRLPVAFHAESAREILRALEMARSFKLDPIVTDGRESDQVIPDLKAANARVIVSLNYPVRPPSIAPDADESVSTLRARANAPKTPAALEKGGVLFAFESDGLSDPKDFLKNAAKAVQAGLSRDAALEALTVNAAAIAGAADRVGSLEAGKIANLVITDGELFEEKTAIKHVFVAGRPVNLDLGTPATSERPR
jgi:imidazolonepropionase-like amidohydrolase